MRSRNIKPGFFKDEELAEIEPLGRLLFAGLWCLADREGRLEDRPKRIKAEVLPYDDCDVDALLWQLHKKGSIIRYEVNGEQYIQVAKFSIHQNPHPNEKPSVIPAPSDIAKIREDSVTAREENISTQADSLILIPDPLIPESKRAMCVETPHGAHTEPDEEPETLPSEPKKDEATQVMDEYNRLFEACWKRPLRLTPERKAKIRARLKAFSLTDLFMAMANIRASPFHCGENEKGQVYATPEFIFRNDAMVDKWVKQVNRGDKRGASSGNNAKDYAAGYTEFFKTGE